MTTHDMLTPPSVSVLKPTNYSFPQPVRLSNGIPLYIVPGSSDPVNRITLLFNGGLAQCACPLQSTLAVQSLFDGSAVRSAGEIQELIDYYGVWKSANSIAQHSVLTIATLSKYLPDILAITCECINDPQYDTAEFKIAQKRLTASYASAQKQVGYMAMLQAKKAYYGAEHPLALSITRQAIESLTTDDLHRFRKQYFTADNLQVILAGQMSDADVAMLNSTLGQLPIVGESFVPTLIEPVASQPYSFVPMPEAQQTGIVMLLPFGPLTFIERIRLGVLVTAFGGYFGSRLMSNIREDKGYTYGIYAYMSSQGENSMMVISTECRTENAEQVVAEIHNEMRNLVAMPIPEEEMHAIKQYRLSELYKSLDTPFSKTSLLAEKIVHDLPEDCYNIEGRVVSEITADELQQLATKYFSPQKLLTVIAGPKSL